MFDGYIPLPQLHILIPLPLHDSIDVHGFGKEDETDLPGLLHGVVGFETARKCVIKNIVPSGDSCTAYFKETGKFFFL